MALARDLDEALFVRSAWKLWILIPAWTASTAMLMALTGLFTYRLAETIEDWKAQGGKTGLPPYELVWEGTNIGFSALSLIANFVEISKLATDILTPVVMISTQVIKLTLCFAILGLDIVAKIRDTDGYYSLIGLVIDCALLFVTLTTIGYAISVHRRVQKFEDFQLEYLHRNKRFDSSVEMGLGPGDQLYDGVDGGRSAFRGTRREVQVPLPDSAHASQEAHLPAQASRAMRNEFGWQGGGSGRSGGSSTGGMPRKYGSLVGRGQVPISQAVAHETEDRASSRRLTLTSEGGLVSVREEDEEVHGEPEHEEGDNEDVGSAGNQDTRPRLSVVPELAVSGHEEAEQEADDESRRYLLTADHDAVVGRPLTAAGYRDHPSSE